MNGMGLLWRLEKHERLICSIFCCFPVFVGSIFAVILYSEGAKEKVLLNNIQQIPMEDRWVLEDFFRNLILDEGGAYTLFGDKPMTYDAWFEISRDDIPSILISGRIFMANERLAIGWKTWEKYRHLFPSRNYLLMARHRNEHWIELLLINRLQFAKKVKENLCEFGSAYENGFFSKSVLKQYEDGSDSLFRLLKEHHGLFGILLGYGKRNAYLYHERDRILLDFFHFTLKTNPRPSPEFKTVEEEMEYFQRTLTQVFGKSAPKAVKYLSLPCFIVDPGSGETQELRRKYLYQRRGIQKIYCRGDFLVTTLRRFCLY